MSSSNNGTLVASRARDYGTSQNLYRARGLHEQIKLKGEVGLLKNAYAIDRNSTALREALLKGPLYYFDHASHEWSADLVWR